MKYQEQIELAKEGVAFLQNGKSVEEFKPMLPEKKLFKTDIDKVWRSCKSMLVKEYEGAFKGYVLNGQIDNHRSEYSNFKDDVFEEIKSGVIEDIRTEAKHKVNKLIEQGLDAEDIIPEVESAVFTADDIMKYGESYYKENVKVSGQEKSNYQVLGGLLIVVGAGLTFYSLYNPSGDKSIFFFGLIIAGVVLLVKSNSTKGEIERMNKL